MAGNIKCPICGGKTALRIAKRGSNAGRKFWVCQRYPECRGKAEYSQGLKEPEPDSKATGGGSRQPRVSKRDVSPKRPSHFVATISAIILVIIIIDLVYIFSSKDQETSDSVPLATPTPTSVATQTPAATPILTLVVTPIPASTPTKTPVRTSTPTPVPYPTPAPIIGTNVSGIISSDTVWRIENSPYVVTDTVEIPSGVTLTIEPGVAVYKPSSGDMFLLNGIICARGYNGSEIIFDGGGNSNFFNAKNSNADTFLDLEYCVIRNGLSFWPDTGFEQYGHFSLRRSQLMNLSDGSYIAYPRYDVYIEYNRFINASGFSIGLTGDTRVYVRYNLFNRKNIYLPDDADYFISNWAIYGTSQTIVQYNSFLNISGIALELKSGYAFAAMSAVRNYWGTTNNTRIDSEIYDKKDDVNCSLVIPYLPVLRTPHPDTPK